MEEFKSNFHILKAVKKTTYNGIIIQTKLNLNSESEPVKLNACRSKSFKRVTNFVPNIKPRKSTFAPTPLQLNKHNNNFREEDELEKQLSDNEIKIVENNSSCSSLSSSQLNNLSGEEMDKKDKRKENVIEPIKKNSSCNIIEKISLNNFEKEDDFLYINENRNEDVNKNMKALRKKMSNIKAKVGIFKYKETEEIVSDNLKKNFDVGPKKYENEEENIPTNLHGSIKFFENNNNLFSKAKSKSIFEVLTKKVNEKEN